MQFRKSIAALTGTAVAIAALAVTAAPAFAQTNQGLTVYADTVTNQGCLQTNVFHRGIDILVWRINVLKDGVQDKNAKVSVQVKGGQTFQAPYNTHDDFFTAAWNVPFNAKTGTIQYTVTATDGSLSGTYTPQFMVAPSELMIVPATYGVNVNVGSGSKSATSFAKTVKSIPVSAQVGITTSSQGKTSFAPMTAGTVKAAIGLEGNINAKGEQINVKVATLKYNAKTKAWTGSISTSGLKAGIYVVSVNAADTAKPANTGAGASLGFEVQ